MPGLGNSSVPAVGVPAGALCLMAILRLGGRARLAAELPAFFLNGILASTLAAAMTTGHDLSFRIDPTQAACQLPAVPPASRDRAKSQNSRVPPGLFAARTRFEYDRGPAGRPDRAAAERGEGKRSINGRAPSFRRGFRRPPSSKGRKSLPPGSRRKQRKDAGDVHRGRRLQNAARALRLRFAGRV